MLSNVSEQRYFKVADGTVLKNLSDLGAALLHMDENVFRHHVTPERNDFYNWVRDVHKDQRLALELMHAKTRQDAAISVNRRVQELLQPTPIPLPAASPQPMIKPEVKEIKQLFSPSRAALPAPVSPIPAKQLPKSLPKKPSPLSSKTSFKKPVSRRKPAKITGLSGIVSVSRNVTPIRKDISEQKSSFISLTTSPLQKHQLIIVAVAVVFLVFFLGTSSQVISITGGAVSGPSPEEIQFIGIWGAVAVIVLVVVALKVLRERHSKA